jgi:hypothetical protein
LLRVANFKEGRSHWAIVCHDSGKARVENSDGRHQPGCRLCVSMEICNRKGLPEEPA